MFAVVVPNDVERVLPENVRPLPIVSAPTVPLELVERMDEFVPSVRPLVALRSEAMVDEPTKSEVLATVSVPLCVVFPEVSVPKEALVENRLVDDAVVEKRLVVVALVLVELFIVTLLSVDVPSAVMPPRENIPERPTLSPPPAKISLPTFKESEILMVFDSIAPIEAVGLSRPLISTTAIPFTS